MKRIHRAASLVLALFIIIGITAPTANASSRYLKNGIGFVTASSLRLRSSASSTSETLDYASGNDVAVVLGKTGSWYKVNYNLQIGYMHQDYLDNNTRENGELGYGKINGNNVKVRSGPGTGYSVLGYLNTGDRVTITEQKTVGSMTWGKMSKGWICMSYVKLDQVEEDKTESVWGTVNVNEFLRIRKGPGTSYAIAGYLGPKDRVEILERKTVGSTVWGRISQGWISLDYVILDQSSGSSGTATETPATKTMTVIADCLLIRQAPGTSNAIVGYLYTGAKVEVLETKTVDGRAWARISKGWVCMDYLK